MAESVAELTVDVGVGRESLTSFLAKLETQLERSNTTLERFAAQLERRTGGSQERAAQSTLTHAQALATLKARTGDLVSAEAILNRAIQDAGTRTTAVIRAETQLAGIRKQLVDQTRNAATTNNSFASSILQLAGPLGVATTGVGAFLAVANKVKEGFELRATLDEQRRSIGTLLGDVQKGDRVFQQAAEFGRRYGFTQKEMGESAAAAAPLIKSSITAVEKQLEVLARLASLNSKEGFQGATFSAKELASGDITSIVERFNIARSAANKMKQEIASGKDVFQVLDAQLNRMGVTVDVLKNRTEGAAGAMRTYAQSQEDLTLAMGRFAEGPGVKILDFLSKFTDTITNAVGGDVFGPQAAQAEAIQGKLIAAATSFEDYGARVQVVNAQIDQAFANDPIGAFVAKQIGGFQQLTPLQFQYAQGLLQTGVSAQQAVAQTQAMAGTIQNLEQIQASAALQSEEMGSTLAALGPQILQVASAGPEAASGIFALATGYLSGAVSAEQFRVVLDAQIAAQRQATIAANEHNLETSRTGPIIDTAGQAAAAYATELENEAAKAQLSAVQSQILAVEKENLARQAQAAANAILASGGNIEATAARLAASSSLVDQLTAAYLRLASAQAAAGAATARYGQNADRLAAENGRTSGADAAAFVRAQEEKRKAQDKVNAALRDQKFGLADNAGQIRILQSELDKLVPGTEAYVRKQTELLRLQQQGAKGGRGGRGAGGASSTKLTDQAKLNNSLLADQDTFNAKFEDEELKHANKLLDIQADFAEKMRDAQDSFQQSQLDGRAGFYDNLGKIEDAGLRQALSAQYEQAAVEAGQIAAEKGADVAEKYLAAKQQVLEAQAKRQADIAAAEKDGDKGQADYLRGVDRLYRDAEEAKLARIKEGDDSIKAQRDAALAEESLRYEEATGKIAESADRAADRKILAAERAGKAIDEEQLKLDALAKTYDRVAPARSGGSSATPAAATADSATAAAPTPAAPVGDAQPVRDADVAAALAGVREAVERVEKAVQAGSSRVASAVSSNGGGIR